LPALAPISTVGHPTMIFPPWAIESPIRAAGWPPTNTVGSPWTITSGGPTQVAMSPMRAAGWPPIRTVGQPAGRIGPPTCGTTPVTIGQTCISPILAAGWPIGNLYQQLIFTNEPFTVVIPLDTTSIFALLVSTLAVLSIVIFTPLISIVPSFFKTSLLAPHAISIESPLLI